MVAIVHKKASKEDRVCPREADEVKALFKRCEAFKDSLDKIMEMYMTIEIGRLLIPSVMEQVAEEMGELPEPVYAMMNSLFGIKPKKKKRTVPKPPGTKKLKKLEPGEN